MYHMFGSPYFRCEEYVNVLGVWQTWYLYTYGYTSALGEKQVGWILNPTNGTRSRTYTHAILMQDRVREMRDNTVAYRMQSVRSQSAETRFLALHCMGQE